MHRAPFPVYFGLALLMLPAGAGAQMGVLQMLATPSREKAASLAYQVHIAPTALPAGSSSIETGDGSWAARGYDLRTLIALVYGVDGRRVEFADLGVATARFDLTATLPDDTDPAQMQSVLTDALERRFGLTISTETRAMDVYVLTAPHGPSAAMKRHVTRISAAEIAGLADSSDADDASRVTVFGQNCTDKDSQTGIAVEASTITDFQRTLEPDLDRVLVDETKLSGSFDFTVSKYSSQQELFRLMHDQLGLVVTPAERNVMVLTVRRADEKPQSLRADVTQLQDSL